MVELLIQQVTCTICGLNLHIVLFILCKRETKEHTDEHTTPTSIKEIKTNTNERRDQASYKKL